MTQSRTLVNELVLRILHLRAVLIQERLHKGVHERMKCGAELL